MSLGSGGIQGPTRWRSFNLGQKNPDKRGNPLQIYRLSARTVDNGNFYAQMKAPTRIRDAVDGVLGYRWVETGPLEFDYFSASPTCSRPLRSTLQPPQHLPRWYRSRG